MMSRKNTQTRNRILEITWKLLEDGQGSAVRMSDIAKAAGLSRQAVYLHFPSRSELLIATTRYLDEVFETDKMLAPSRAAKTGPERLDAYIEAWGSHIPKIYGVAKALMAMMETDAEAAAAWNDRMGAMRHGCQAAVKAVAKDGLLADDLNAKRATDLLWTLLSVRNWEQLRFECALSNRAYIKEMKRMARRALLA